MVWRKTFLSKELLLFKRIMKSTRNFILVIQILKSRLIQSTTRILLDLVSGIFSVEKRSCWRTLGMCPWGLCWTYPGKPTGTWLNLWARLHMLENRKSAKFLLNSIHQDARSTTGSNLRNILLKTNKSSIDELCPTDAEVIEYYPVDSKEKWRIPFISEIIESKHSQLEIPNLADEDLDEMLTFLCISWIDTVFPFLYIRKFLISFLKWWLKYKSNIRKNGNMLVFYQ